MAEKKILTLHLTDEWYQKIDSGEKTEEYRECSVFWAMRLLRKDIPNRADVIAGVAKYHRASDRGFLCKAILLEDLITLRIVRKIGLFARWYWSLSLTFIFSLATRKIINRISKRKSTR